VAVRGARQADGLSRAVCFRTKSVTALAVTADQSGVLVPKQDVSNARA
jgi:hypothetical protein